MKKFLTFVFAAICLISATNNAFACACCAEKGTYNISTEKPDQNKLELLKTMKFDRAAELFTDASEFESIKGLKDVQADYSANDWEVNPVFFSLENIFSAKTWKFNFKTKSGKSGILNLPLPTQMVNFRADIHDTPKGNEVILYKEWRFKGTVQSGSGFFKSGILPQTTYFLVLQGRGNNCDNAEDFNNWRLEITGKNADYAFFGKMNQTN